MKTLKMMLMTIVFFLLNTTIYSQIIGIDISKAKTFENASDEELFYIVMPDNTKAYGMSFETTPVGLKHCVEKVKGIIELNGLSFENPNLKKDELYSSFVEGITDYSNLELSLSTGNAEVNRMWKMASGNRLGLFLTKDRYVFMVNLMAK